MAYGLKYELYGKSVPFGKNWKVRISKDGYAGAQIDRDVPTNPFTLKKDSAGTIRGTSLDFAIRAVSDFEFIDLYTNNSRDWLIELVNNSNVVVWKGFILPEEYQESYSPAPVTVKFTATDGLGLLKNYTYNAPESVRISQLNILANCFFYTGLALDFSIAISIIESRQDLTRSVLDQIFVDNHIYNGMTCYDVIKDILSRYDADVTQHGGKWLIRSSESKLATRLIYSSLAIYIGTQAAPAIQTLGSLHSSANYPTGSPLSLALKTAERIVTIKESYGYIGNMLPLQTAKYWTSGSVLTGWSSIGAGVFKFYDLSESFFTITGLINSSNQYANGGKVEVNNIQATTNDIKISFDFGLLSTVTDSRFKGTIFFKIKIVGTSTTYYLDKKLGWFTTSKEIQFPDIVPSSDYTNVTFYNFSILASGLPVDGKLVIEFYVPGPNNWSIFNNTTSSTVLKNVKLVTFIENKEPSPGIDYQVVLNSSTKADKKEISWVGGDIPDIPNQRLIFSNYTSLTDGTATGLWKIGTMTPMLLIELIGKIYASQNRKAKQYLTGTIRGENLEFDTILQHSYPTSRKFEILEASYELCVDKANVTLVEMFSFEEPSYTIITGDLGSTSLNSNASSGSGGVVSITNITNLIRPPQYIAAFASLATPTISGYNDVLVDTYGQHPTIRIWTLDGDGNYQERSEKPKITIVDSLITAISFKLAKPETGIIIIQ